MTTLALGNKRLLELARILSRVPNVPKKVNGKIRGYDQTVYSHPCGTPACAWGYWEYSDKSRFKRLAKAAGYPKEDIADAVAHWHEASWPVGVPEDELRICQLHIGVYHSQKEFALESGDVVRLFGGYGCDGAQNGKQAAAYIRNFVKERTPKRRTPKKRTRAKS